MPQITGIEQIVKAMGNFKLAASLLLVFLASLALSKPQRYETYTYQGAEVRRWHDMDPYFFQSHRINPLPQVHHQQHVFPISQLVPSVIYPEPNSYDYPHYDSRDYDYSHPLPLLPSRPKTRQRDFNITVERMGGFGGSGDTKGYGAYEYKPVDNSLDSTPFSDYFKEKSKRNHYDIHSLQQV